MCYPTLLDKRLETLNLNCLLGFYLNLLFIFVYGKSRYIKIISSAEKCPRGYLSNYKTRKRNYINFLIL